MARKSTIPVLRDRGLSLRKVAKAAKVSYSQVDRAIKNERGVSERTKKKISKIIDSYPVVKKAA